MTKLHVRRKVDSLRCGVDSPGLEHQQCDRMTGKCVTSNEFKNDIQINVLAKQGWVNDLSLSGINKGVERRHT